MNDSPQDPPQSLLAHLADLRYRLLLAFGGVLVAMIGILPFARQLHALISLPMRAVLPEGASMIATEVAAPFLAPLRLSFFLALVLAMPWVCYQIWAFVSPALYRREKIIGILLLPISVLLFYAGMLFCWALVFPVLFSFFVGFAPQGVAIMTDISRYLDFVLRFMLVFGFAFETPVIIVALAASGAVKTATLARARPYLILVSLVVAMLLTPPDVVSQLMLAVPIWVLYESALLVLRILRV